MPNRSSCRRPKGRSDQEIGCPQVGYHDSRGVDSRENVCDHECERDEERHSCSRSCRRECKVEKNDFNAGMGRAKRCGDDERRGLQKDRFEARRLNSGSRSVDREAPKIDCPRLREKSTEACACNRSTSHGPKTDRRTFSAKAECDRRARSVDAGRVSISACHATPSSYRRSASDNCASQRCKLDGADEPSRRCCRSNDDPRGEESPLPTTPGIKCTSRHSHKCRTSRNTPLPAVRENLGGGMNCRRCERKVYHAEMQLVSGEAYHRICFSCFCCRKPLEPFTYEEHCREIFCKQCYTRNFGPQGYGYGTGAGVLQTPL
ncbi:LIM domain and actin-binding protein 1-like isoform X2 [Nasonia vitripennis]|uniref:LIM zinc-binding domain-containing protein n=1 Tax=Nasonia vitripennis TaxID=7425 RepID=A0A7M7HDW5_NASVI|nr:LIM domain and actin-binding protein 1-like isoform X2 [Nasonia vitripennis]XP_032451988.1 LIM domain and actin-binding protein 1-like isoform X2 [Nasonia vitripennis]XP_032451989.1 LIM domain and actin-binding protein 1-like isoform X2 [Nasonia vitripennis]XP_032451990.1 LIM domain and actin-binding protein 1-like isoform X2 [Nasonia vitripennis]